MKDICSRLLAHLDSHAIPCGAGGKRYSSHTSSRYSLRGKKGKKMGQNERGTRRLFRRGVKIEDLVIRYGESQYF